jgi:hypothetical protein
VVGVEVITPEPCFRLVAEIFAEVGFLTVNVDGQPLAGLKILAPAIKVEVEAPFRGPDAGAVHANHGKVMVLNPNASLKRSHLLILPGTDINRQAADVPEVFPADRIKGIVLPIKMMPIYRQRFQGKGVHLKMRF